MTGPPATTGPQIESWKYIPVDESLTIDNAARSYLLETHLGPLDALIGGDFEWVDGRAATRYSMPRVRYDLFGRTVREQERDLAGKPMRVYDYFWATDRLLW